MGWLSKPGDINPEAPVVTPGEPPAKTQAELIAESVAAAMKPFADGMAALNQRVGEVADQTRRPAAPAEPMALSSVFDDENAAFQQRMGPLLVNQLTLSAKMAKDEVRREYERKGFGDVWQQFEQEIDSVLDASALVDTTGRELRGSKDYIRNTVDMIFGRAAVKAGVRFDGKKSTFFLEGAGGGTEVSAGGAVNDGLTEQQRRAAAKWGMTVEQMKGAKDKLAFVN